MFINYYILQFIVFNKLRSLLLYYFLFQNLPFASECELKPSPLVSQSVGMMQNPYVNQMFNSQMYQQQSMMTLESHQKSTPQTM